MARLPDYQIATHLDIHWKGVEAHWADEGDPDKKNIFETKKIIDYLW